MAKGRKKTCVCCGGQIEDFESFVPYKKRYAHEKCFNIAIKAVHADKKEKIEQREKEKKNKTPKAKPKAELKDGMSEEDFQKKKAYYDYLRSLIGDENMTAKVYVVSEKLIDQQGFTFESMHNTLVYLNEILQKEIEGDGLGLIRYYHDEAKQYYAELNRIEQLYQDVNVEDMYHETTVVVRNAKRPTKQIDINLI